MSFQTLEAVATRTAVVRVNLLPPEFEEARRARRLQIGLGACLITVVAAAAGAYGVTAGHVADAQSALEAEQSRTAGLQAAQAPYAEVPKVEAQLRDAQAVAESVAAHDIPWYSYVDQLATNAPAELSLTSLTFAVNDTSAGTSATGTDPLAVTGVGTLSVTGQTKSQDKVAGWLESIGTIGGLANPTLTNSAYDASSGVVTFTSGATVTEAALLTEQ
ncbi:PilN domain-containing protein [Kineococcus radiotolerans]|uniref:Fimbrial assembly family protein n=1 Tax=Kineococcus radiotolerans (strain ATCC BAA-149 / DSM 14245 / SRS30216) TaxID=266940 RepID=A6WCE3_KINRD|nr:hypothetical protein [Kineococcus radiotolerans]ABS04482.1 Fimbrial assembly family protein [Kineococcus radiotolerans SRS30216 = ATCC BAA-149]